MINLSPKQKQAILSLLENYSKPSPKEYERISSLLGKQIVKKIDIKGLAKYPQDGWTFPLYEIVDLNIDLPEGYALHFLGGRLVSLHDAAVYLYAEIYNNSNKAREWINGISPAPQ